MGRHKVTVDGMSACGKTRLITALAEYATTHYHGTVKPPEPLDGHPSVITALDIQNPESLSIVFFEYTYESRLVPLAYPHTKLVLFSFPLDYLFDTGVQYDVEDKLDYLISKKSPKSKGVPLILVGCRNDLRKQQEHANPSKGVSERAEYLKQYAKKSRLAGYFECSAESGEGIPELLQAVINILLFGFKESSSKNRQVGSSRCIVL